MIFTIKQIIDFYLSCLFIYYKNNHLLHHVLINAFAIIQLTKIYLFTIRLRVIEVFISIYTFHLTLLLYSFTIKIIISVKQLNHAQFGTMYKSIYCHTENDIHYIANFFTFHLSLFLALSVSM